MSGALEMALSILDYGCGRARPWDEEAAAVRALIAERDRLREAAQPFVALADIADALRHPDDSTCPHRIRAADLRALKTAVGVAS